MVEIKDNYLSTEEYIFLKNNMESTYFPWYYNHNKTWQPTSDPKLFEYQFVHIFYNNDKVNSNKFDHLDPIIKKLKPLSLIRVKANLTPISHKLIKSDKHYDQNFKCKIAIYYLNDNNGYTMIGDKKVESKSNRMVLFDSDKEHYGTNSTNCNNRIIINFNYF
tara:strand:+ start:237 stop:725 length:489 start_codon:yes stop_codon:yes gene_type:complete